MMTLINERRKALIERLKKIASWAETYGPDHNVMLPASEAKEIAEIALESLTTEASVWIKPGSLGFPRLAGIDAVTIPYVPEFPVPLYTAPPVSVIKFPDLLDIPDGYDLQSCMAGAAWYQQEIKRLNGLGE